MMTIDETFDVGIDTRTGLDDSYKLPFKFTGTIDKLKRRLTPTPTTNNWPTRTRCSTLCAAY